MARLFYALGKTLFESTLSRTANPLYEILCLIYINHINKQMQFSTSETSFL